MNAQGRARFLVAVIFFSAFLLAGCSDSNVAKVSGKVSYKGEAVKGGGVTFLPKSTGTSTPGKPAAAEVKTDGSFVLGTYGTSDGAVIGKHQISFTPPSIPLPEGKQLQPGESAPRSPYEGLVPQQTEVEIKPGSNTINIELVPPGQK